MRKGLREIVHRQQITATVEGFGSVFVLYFQEPPIVSYTDLLRNDAGKFVAYRRELIEHGIYELPVNLKRNHISLVHTEEDIDTKLEIADKALKATFHG